MVAIIRLAERKERHMPSSESTGSSAAHAAMWGQQAHEWARLEERNSPLYDAVFDRLALSAGMRLLDVGCGTGVACQLAVQRGAVVEGLDATLEALDIARTRVPEGAFHVGDMEQLPFDTASFDVVTSFNAFQYAANPAQALTEARRVVRPDGRVVIEVWGRPERNEAFLALQRAINSFLPPPPPGASGPLALSSEGVLAALVQEAGLTALVQDAFVFHHEYANEEDAIRLSTAGGPAARAMQVAGAEPVRRAVARTLTPYRQMDGTYRVEYEFTYLIATA
jgi:SAM-dependent methyltransferase